MGTRRLVTAVLGAVALLGCLAGGAALAQGTATVSGTVTTTDGAAAHGAVITAHDLGSGRMARAFSDVDGTYTLSDLLAGRYRLAVRLQGFDEVVRTVDVDDGASVEEDFTLTPGILEAETSVTAVKGARRDLAVLPQSVTVITEDEIEERQIPFAGGAMERAPNLDKRAQNPALDRPQYRGLDSSRVLVLVDGERLNDSRYAVPGDGASPALLDTVHFEALEVLGGAGGVYGTDALSGVVNVVTKHPERSVGGDRLDFHLDYLYNDNKHQRGAGTFNYSRDLFSVLGIFSTFDNEGWRGGDGSIRRDRVTRSGELAQAIAEARGSEPVATTFGVYEYDRGEEVFNSESDGFNFQTELWIHPSDQHNFRIEYWTSQHEDLGTPQAIPFVKNPFDPVGKTSEFRDVQKYALGYEGLDLASWLPQVDIRAYQQKRKQPLGDNLFIIDEATEQRDSETGEPVKFSSWELDEDGNLRFTGAVSQFTKEREQTTLTDVTSQSLEARAKLRPWRDAYLTTGLVYLHEESEDRFNVTRFVEDEGDLIIFEEFDVATIPDVEYDNVGLFAHLEWAPAPWVRIDGGVRFDNWQSQANPTAGFGPDHERYILDNSLGQLLANPGQLQVQGFSNALARLLSGAGSIDTDEDYVSGSFGLSFPTAWGLVPYVRWGQSYREPDLVARYQLQNTGTIDRFLVLLPNTELEAEEAQSIDLGIKINRPNWRASLGWFHNELDEVIDTVFSDDVTITPDTDVAVRGTSGRFAQRINRGEAEFEGVEATFQGSFALPGNYGSLSPYISFSHLTAEDTAPTAGDLAAVRQLYNRDDVGLRLDGDPNDVPFGAVVENQGLFTLRYTSPAGRWFLEYELRWVDDIDRLAPSVLSTPFETQFGLFASLDGYERHSLRGAYEFKTRVPIRLGIGVENLTDEIYYEPFELGLAPGLAYVFSVQVRWFDVLSNLGAVLGP